MCDIESERRKIDALLENAARAAPARIRANERALAAFCLGAAREFYSPDCPDECLQRRCAEFAARVLRRDAAQSWRDRARAPRRTA